MRRTKEEAMQTRDAVLSASARIIARLGVSAFTIDAVAKEAGITKGGVLHHFPSKEALIDGLIDQVSAALQARITAELAAEAEGTPGRWLRAYIRTIFAVEDDVLNLIPALASAVTADARMIERIRRSIEASQQAAIEHEDDRTQATILRLAVDGFLFTKAFNLNVLDAHERQAVYERLLSLTHMQAAQP